MPTSPEESTKKSITPEEWHARERGIPAPPVPPEPSSEGLAPTAPTSWRRKQRAGFIVPLPSGNAVRMRRTMDLFELVRAGQIPNPLAGIVNKAIRSTSPQNAFDMNDLDEESMTQLLDLIDKQLPNIVLEPKMVPVPEGENPRTWEPDDPNALSIAEVDLEDKLHIYAVAQGGAADLAAFREQQNNVMASAQGGQGIREEA